MYIVFTRQLSRATSGRRVGNYWQGLFTAILFYSIVYSNTAMCELFLSESKKASLHLLLILNFKAALVDGTS